MRNKIIVGVHGIGDQVRYETIQAIAYQFCRYYKIPAAVSLGSLHSSDLSKDGIIDLNSSAGKLYFTEAYWADIARTVAKDGYTLEETKQWAKTIVERFREQAQEYKKASKEHVEEEWFGARIHKVAGFVAGQDREIYRVDQNNELIIRKVDYRMIKSVLYEAIDTVDVMEKLLLVAGKAGIFEYNLNWVLTNFLGDVQIVTEFEKYRSEIIEKFIATVSNAYAHAKDTEADIYIISHSEGTVVSFLGLLEAMKRGETKCPWIKKVKGFMTLGSPIDKHLTLWPHLWDEYNNLSCNNIKEKQINWRNYYDRGDPVGYELDTARDWIGKNCKALDFNKDHDYGFSRYYLPGKAHVDYWRDNEVFDNFISGVVDKDKTTEASPQEKNETGPKDGMTAMFVCNVVPYIGIFLLLSLAVYFIYKPVYNCLHPDQSETASLLIRKVGGIAAILAGMSVMARMPRLTPQRFWAAISVLIFSLFATASYILLGNEGRNTINSSFSGISYLVVAALVSAISALIGYLFSTTRVKLLVALGGLAVLWSAANIAFSNPHQTSVWPVFIGGAVFLYGWWLSILLFDLVFVWHMYIRYSKALTRLREIRVNHQLENK